MRKLFSDFVNIAIPKTNSGEAVRFKEAVNKSCQVTVKLCIFQVFIYFLCRWRVKQAPFQLDQNCTGQKWKRHPALFICASRELLYGLVAKVSMGVMVTVGLRVLVT